MEGVGYVVGVEQFVILSEVSPLSPQVHSARVVIQGATHQAPLFEEKFGHLDLRGQDRF